MTNEIKLEDLPYANDLKLILGYCKLDFPDFPDSCCQYSARLIKKVVPSLQEVAGYFDEMPYDGKANWHAWNYDSKRRLFIDLTAKQFNENLPEILIVPQTDERYVLKRENTLWARNDKFRYDEFRFLENYYIYTKNPNNFVNPDKKTQHKELILA